MKKNLFLNVLSLMLVFVASMFGGGVAIAACYCYGRWKQLRCRKVVRLSPIQDAGATVTTGMEVTEENDPDFYAKAVDERITRMRPMRTPIDQITRSAKSISRVNSMVVQYYSVATRPIKATLTANCCYERF